MTITRHPIAPPLGLLQTLVLVRSDPPSGCPQCGQAGAWLETLDPHAGQAIKDGTEATVIR